LLVILTPHVVRSRADADRILAEESRRIDWILGDVVKTHGTAGMEPVFPLPVPGVGPAAPCVPAPAVLPVVPDPMSAQPGVSVPAPATGSLQGARSPTPANSATPAVMPMGQAANLPPPTSTAMPANYRPSGSTGSVATAPPAPPPAPVPLATEQAAGDGSGPSVDPPKEKREWNPFRRRQ